MRSIPEQERALQQFQAAVQATVLPGLWSYDVENPVVLEILVAGKVILTL